MELSTESPDFRSEMRKVDRTQIESRRGGNSIPVETKRTPSRASLIAGTRSLSKRDFTTYPNEPTSHAASTMSGSVKQVRKIAAALLPVFLILRLPRFHPE